MRHVLPKMCFSLNPAVDIGQLEGGFMMGLGLNTTELVKYDVTTGQMISYDTWVSSECH